MKSKLKTAGWILLAVGVLMLATGLVLSFTVGSLAVPILVTSSILVNSTGITLLRHKTTLR